MGTWAMYGYGPRRDWVSVGEMGVWSMCWPDEAGYLWVRWMLSAELRCKLQGSLPAKVIQEAQGLGALLDKMEDNDHINWITQRSRCIFHSKTAVFETQGF